MKEFIKRNEGIIILFVVLFLTLTGMVGIVNGLDAVRQKKIDECLKLADEKYEKRWESTCKKLELEEGCMLPLATSSSYNDTRQFEKNVCIERNK